MVAWMSIDGRDLLQKQLQMNEIPFHKILAFIVDTS